jgi:RecA/RadA recombinase
LTVCKEIALANSFWLRGEQFFWLHTMPLLSRLALSVLTTDVLAILQSINVRTVEDLLFPSSKTKGLLPLLFEPTKLDEIIESVRSVYMRPATTAAELYDIMRANCATIFSTGCKQLDILLGGGIYSGELTEIVGQAATGKTQLCMSTALNACLHSSYNVAYIDTANSFSGKRVAEMYNSIVSHQLSDIEEKKRHFREVFSRIRIFKAFDIFTFFNILFQLKELLEKKTSDFGFNLKMIIIDSLATLLAQNLVQKQLLGHAMMSETARYLKIFALDHQIAVLVLYNRWQI